MIREKESRGLQSTGARRLVWRRKRVANEGDNSQGNTNNNAERRRRTEYYEASECHYGVYSSSVTNLRSIANNYTVLICLSIALR